MAKLLKISPVADDDLKMEHLIETLCNRLRVSELANDIDRVTRARDLLTKFQHREMFERILGPGQYMPEFEEELATLTADMLYSGSHFKDEKVESKDEIEIKEDAMDLLGEEEAECVPLYEEFNDDLPENTWHGYFRGYQILNEVEEFNISENKKCVEISKSTTDDNLEGFIRYGVKCFCIDLFVGSIYENQELVVRLHQTELKISREIGYPVSTTLLAKLSPRLQYTGDLDPDLPADQLDLQKDDELILTTERRASSSCNKQSLFVNATFLLDDVKCCDIILVGPDIQLIVQANKSTYLDCRALKGGALTSRMPVRFPAKCDKYHISVEEMEDITFCKELGINIIISHIIGIPAYFNDLIKTLKVFKCDRMRLWAAVRLNELKGCEDEHNWAAEAYEGFVVSFIPPKNKEQAEILHLCPAAENFIEHAFTLRKPIIVEAISLALKQYTVAPSHHMQIFFYPDKYMFRYDELRKSFGFFLLQEALNGPLLKQDLSQQPYCDESLTGSDSLARSAVAAAFEMNAKAIIVLGLTGRMTKKLAHFRPQVPIIFVTQMQSAAGFIHAHHNVIMLYYIHKPAHMPQWTLVYKHLVFGLSFSKHQKILQNNDNVILIYGENKGTTFPDKYVSYKFDQKHYAKHLKVIVKPHLSNYGAFGLPPFVNKYFSLSDDEFMNTESEEELSEELVMPDISENMPDVNAIDTAYMEPDHNPDSEQ